MEQRIMLITNDYFINPYSAFLLPHHT